jgi:PAS domain S-box-containing protein
MVLRSHPWRVLGPLLAGIALAAVAGALSPASALEPATAATSVLGPLLTLAGLLLHRPSGRTWYLSAIGGGLAALGLAAFHLQGAITGTLPGSPSASDVLWVLSLGAYALALVARDTLGRSVAEAATLALALLMLSGTHLIGPLLDAEGAAAGFVASRTAYAVMDVIAIGCGIRLLLAIRPTPADLLLCGGVLIVVSADFAWNLSLLHGSMTPSGLLVAGWIAGPLVIGAAALHPSMVLARPTAVARRPLRWWNALVLGASPLIGPGLLALADPGHTARIIIFCASAAMAVLVVGRLLLLVHEGTRRSDELAANVVDRERLLDATQQRYQHLVEQLPGVIYIAGIGTDADDTSLTYISPQAETILGLTVEECLADTSIMLAAIHPDDEARVREEFRAGLEAGQIPPTEYRFVRRDGALVWLRNEVSVVTDENGVPWLQGILLDISRHKRAEEERDRLELDLRLAQKLEAVGQLAAGIAHEINTPIQFVGDTTRFLHEAHEDLDALLTEYRAALAEAAASPELQARIAAAEDAADVEYLRERVPQAYDRAFDGLDRVGKIVGAMKRFAHPPTSEMVPVDLTEAIESTLVVAANEYKYVADIDVELGALPPVLGNAGDLNQVFLNLIVNAAHAIESAIGDSGERGTIRVTGRADAGHVTITIADTGGGIPADIAGRVFDPFFTTKGVGRGTGQGLAIARTIVTDRHGGALTFDTTPGAGTAFHVRLPTAAKRAAATQEAA